MEGEKRNMESYAWSMTAWSEMSKKSDLADSKMEYEGKKV